MPDNIEELKKYTTDGAGALTLVKWIQNWHNNNIGDIDKQLPYPVLSVSYPEAGDYAVVTLETDYDPISGGEVVIGYTTDGTTPTEVSNPAEFPMNISRNCTLSVRAFLALSEENIVGSVTNSVAISGLKAQEPIISYQKSTEKVTMSTGTSGAVIKYTLNGDEPTESSTQYTGEITLTEDCVIKAKAFKDGLIDSKTAQLTVKTAHIFGVVWDYGQPSSALTRLTPETDPYAYVNETISVEPVPATTDNPNGSSPFDAFDPWMDMKRRNFGDDGTGQFVPAAWDGEQGFSVLKDTMVHIPKFWVNQIDVPENQLRYYYLASKETADFELHPGSDQYVAVYVAVKIGNMLYSQSGQTRTSHNINDARTFARAKGYGWQLMDFAELQAIMWLYIIEFADWNSQLKLGSLDGSFVTGGSDSIEYHTGSNGTKTKYRYIEDIPTNESQHIDGMLFTAGTDLVCLDRDNYNNTSIIGYEPISEFANGTGQYITKTLYDETRKWILCFPSEASGGSSTTYICDKTSITNTPSSPNSLIAFGSSDVSYGLFSLSSNSNNAARPSFMEES